MQHADCGILLLEGCSFNVSHLVLSLCKFDRITPSFWGLEGGGVFYCQTTGALLSLCKLDPPDSGDRVV